MQNKFYDGCELLSKNDINNKRPEIFMCTSNRSAGKTTYFSRLVVNHHIKKGNKFGLIYRFNYELDDICDKFFKDINSLFFPEYNMTSERKASGIYHELFLNDVSCGYALTLNSADNLKKNSHLFSDIDELLFDEFQSETNHYCSEEVRKLISIHTSIARGRGQMSRYVPTYMVANPVSIINPYYVSMDISTRLNDSVNFLRGDGFVLEQGYSESASVAQQESAFNRAFKKHDYIAYSSQAIYLNDSRTFIEKPVGNGKYLCTLKYKNRCYGIVEYAESGYVFCTDKADNNFKNKISVTTDDHQINYVMLKRNDVFLNALRYYFERGCFRFKDLLCKEVVLKALSY